MESASLKIKLTPLMKKFINDDFLCCVEITPEVSKLDNSNEFRWKHKKDTIEYTLPMSYKIVFKKCPSSFIRKEGVEKVYHSCVDLLSSSSVTDQNGLRHISKVSSDHFTFDDNPSKFDNYYGLNTNSKSIEDVGSDIKTNDNDSVIEINPILTHKSTSASNTMADRSCEIVISNQDNNANKVKYHKTLKGNKLIHNLIKLQERRNLSMVEKDNTINNLKCFDDKTDLLVTKRSKVWLFQDDLPKKYMNKNLSKTKITKLSFTPICRVNTEEARTHPVSNMGDATNFIDIQDEMLYFEPLSETLRIKKSSKTNVCVVPKTNSNESLQNHDDVRNRLKNRIIPEIRIAQFRQELEKDFFPLKLMLTEIKRKCDLINPHLLNNPLLNTANIIYPNSNEIVESSNFYSTVNKSNRVVYSIVYED